MRNEEFDNNSYSDQSSSNHKQGSGFGAIVLILIGLVFLIGPLFLPKETLPSTSIFMLSIFGVVVLVIGAILYLLTRLYVKTPSNKAFIRTGMGGKKVVIDGGIIFISMFHELMEILTETMKIVVVRTGEDSLLTKDKLRADVTAEFFIKVEKNPDAVIAAATSLGKKGTNPQAVKSLVEEKLVSALRSVAAQLDLEELNADRQGFAEKVQTLVEKDLTPNGLTLETTTCSKLDQADYRNINVNNVFDAQGAKTVAEKTQQSIVAKNDIEKAAQVQIASKNLETTQQINELKIKEEQSIAEKEKSVQILQAENASTARTKQAEQNRLAREAEIDSEQRVAVKEQQKEQAVATAEVGKQKTVELAKIEKEQTVSVKQQEKEQAETVAVVEKEKTILTKNKEKAVVETEKAIAEAKAAEANQAVITVNEVADADRKKKITIVNQEATAETTKINKNVEADIKAYETVTIAKADKEAAQNRAEAVTVEAEADLKKKKLNAEGETAVQMVPVNVAKAQVAVNNEQVEVTGKELKFKAEFSQVSITLETNLAAIEADKEVGMEYARAMGVAFSNANMNIWGDGNTAQQMMNMFSQGQGTHFKLKALADGGNAKTPIREEAKALVVSYIKGQKTAMEIMGATDNVSTEVKSLVTEFVKSGGGNTLAGIGMMVKFLTGKEATQDEVTKVQELINEIVPDAEVTETEK